MQARHAHGGVARQGGADAIGGLRLALEVQLQRHEGGDLVEDAAQVELPRQAAGQAGDHPEARQIGARQVCDLGVLHLHRHRGTVAQRGTVNLRQRRGRERRLVHLREHLVERPTQLALDPAPYLREGTRRDGVVEACQAADERLSEDVGARADDLAQLDEEPGQVNAQVVEATRRAVVDARPGGRRRRAAEPLAQQEPAVGEDGRERHAGDAQHAIDCEAAEHRLRGLGEVGANRRHGGATSGPDAIGPDHQTHHDGHGRHRDGGNPDEPQGHRRVEDQDGFEERQHRSIPPFVPWYPPCKREVQPILRLNVRTPSGVQGA